MKCITGRTLRNGFFLGTGRRLRGCLEPSDGSGQHPDRQIRVFVAVERAEGDRVAVAPSPNHFQGNVRLVTVDADEDTDIDPVMPDGQVGVVRVDLDLRVNLGIFRPIIRHRDKASRDRRKGRRECRLSHGRARKRLLLNEECGQGR